MTRASPLSKDTPAGGPNGDTFHAPAWIGAALFALTVPVHLVVGRDVSIVVAAVTLALIGGAYIGFGAADGRRRVFWSELAVALLFGLAAILGITWHWAALPAGLALHAGWDLVHHNARHLARIPKWYIPFCVVYDLAVAAFLVLLYAGRV
ncbi:DUF6010 family protein [Pseudaestuariivita atlantica]|uniref:Uncharacterized protein n=1 Tax=Pseudaestuariivita atlantica TaxID=1317121 RepID=A0A0L1JUG4_9RHOB|nr:DUF6010 family protein [Pseudaestuariivita atlantica]KNG95395.1 hypothetical protein ATO11_01940 [Pseudaestuariivita atlantica]